MYEILKIFLGFTKRNIACILLKCVKFNKFNLDEKFFFNTKNKITLLVKMRRKYNISMFENFVIGLN